MNYPVWEVPFIGSGMVIAIIAVIHVMISHFAIGGGLFLPLAEAKALREGKPAWLKKLKGYSKFFLVMTGVFGAVTGVAIWFSIGLVSPSGTSLLIHNFVFGWAIEWVIFLVELAFAAVYYYTWDRISDRLHLMVGYIYAGVSFLTLVIINGILTFMLTPSEAWLSVAGSGQEATQFFNAFFNQTYWPSLALRTLVCLSMAGIFALVVFSRMDGEREGKTKAQMVRWAALWLLPSFFLMPFCMLWYLWMVPESQRELMSIGISTIGMGVFTQVTRMSLVTLMTSATIVVVVYLLAYRSPKDFRFGTALLIVVLAFFATGATEGVRETLRKPYVITDFMYSNGVRKNQVSGLNEAGYFTNSLWNPNKTAITEQIAITNPEFAQHPVGFRMFTGQCMACHTSDGYRSMERLLQGRSEDSIRNILEMLHSAKSDSPYQKFMPPLVGSPEEIAGLRSYLHSLVSKKSIVPVQPEVAGN